MWRSMCCMYPGSQRFPRIRLLMLGLLTLIILLRGALMAQPSSITTDGALLCEAKALLDALV